MRLYDMMSWVYLRHVGLGIGSFYVQYDTRTFYKVLYYGSHRDHSAGAAIILPPKAQLLYESYLEHVTDYPGRLLSVSLTHTDIFMMHSPQKADNKQRFLVYLRAVLPEGERALVLLGDFDEDGTGYVEKKVSFSPPPSLSSSSPPSPFSYPSLFFSRTLPLPLPLPASLLPSTCLPASFSPSLCLSTSLYVSSLFMSLKFFLLAAIDDDMVVKFLFYKAASIFWKVGNGELHSRILDSDSLVHFAWKPHRSYFKLPPEPIPQFI